MRRSVSVFACSAVLCGALAAGASADMPSFSGRLAGTWTCVSQTGTHITKSYGASGTGELVLFNSFVSANGYALLITERYSQTGATVTDVSTADTSAFVGTSPGMDGNSLVFTGLHGTPKGSEYQKMTYTFTDSDHFTRTFASAATAQDLPKIVSSENCTRASAAPLPTPSPTR